MTDVNTNVSVSTEDTVVPTTDTSSTTVDTTQTTTKKATSPKFSIDVVGWKKVGKGLLIGLGGAVLTVLESLATSMPAINVGGMDISPIIATVLNGGIVNFARKFLTEYL